MSNIFNQTQNLFLSLNNNQNINPFFNQNAIPLFFSILNQIICPPLTVPNLQPFYSNSELPNI